MNILCAGDPHIVSVSIDTKEEALDPSHKPMSIEGVEDLAPKENGKNSGLVIA